MQKMEHPLRYGTFMIVLFGIVGFFGSYASTFIWEKLESNDWQTYLGWISVGVILFLAFIIWITSSLIGLPLGIYKFKN